MKTELWVIGNTSFSYLNEGTKIYVNRLKHYLPFEYSIIPDIKNSKNMSNEQIKTKEGAQIIKKLDKGDFLILLDQNGKAFSSLKFANYMEHLLQLSHKRLIFHIGGAYGFSNEIYKRSNGKVSLSKMTFSHQMVRLFVLEQLYRGMTILRNQPYHNE
ncbi:MAG: 23S rRNA (pseudouridine(1915)-N(3))-methyltransferase RlmH [Saprospiraceae bacterium]|nr:23S rRNA (pseudouridine(1915)-N(3))-methyltransferase RlmH [Saprospiraceae bacterium]